LPGPPNPLGPFLQKRRSIAGGCTTRVYSGFLFSGRGGGKGWIRGRDKLAGGWVGGWAGGGGGLFGAGGGWGGTSGGSKKISDAVIFRSFRGNKKTCGYTGSNFLFFFRRGILWFGKKNGSPGDRGFVESYQRVGDKNNLGGGTKFQPCLRICDGVSKL